MRERNRAVIFFLLIILIAANSFAQSPGTILIPRHIYIGDPATLVLQLPAAVINYPDIVITAGSEFFPSDPDIDFHKITLEQRTSGSRLLIEFTPFITGYIELPAIEIGDRYFSDLTVTVNTLIDDKTSPVLSGHASTLAIPGTASIIYGSISILVFLLLFTFWFIFKGRAFIKRFTKKWKRRRQFNMMRKMEKRFQKEILDGEDKRIILDILSEEFRTFLSYLTGYNCRAMTANEFKNLPRMCPGHIITTEDRPYILQTFFKTCDDFRFSGANIVTENLIQLLSDMRVFIDTLENVKENEQKEAAS